MVVEFSGKSTRNGNKSENVYFRVTDGEQKGREQN